MILKAAKSCDLEQILQLQKENFANKTINRNELEQELQNENYHTIVVESDGMIVGVGTVLTVAEFATVTNIATKHKRQGIGTAILLELLSFCKKNGATQIDLEVRKSNSAAINLYEKHGFSEVFRRKNYYKKPTEDAIIMQKLICGK